MDISLQENIYFRQLICALCIYYYQLQMSKILLSVKCCYYGFKSLSFLITTAIWKFRLHKKIKMHRTGIQAIKRKWWTNKIKVNCHRKIKISKTASTDTYSCEGNGSSKKYKSFIACSDVIRLVGSIVSSFCNCIKIFA